MRRSTRRMWRSFLSGGGRRSGAHPGRTCTYEFRSKATGRHTYIGMTNSPRRRFAQHAGRVEGHERKWWWNESDTAHPKITWYSTRKAARKAELRMIWKYRPPGNKEGNPDWERGGGVARRGRPSNATPAEQAGAVTIMAVGALVGEVAGRWTMPPIFTVLAVLVSGLSGWLTIRRAR